MAKNYIHKGIIKEWSENQKKHRSCVLNILEGKEAGSRLNARVNMCLAAKLCSDDIDEDEWDKVKEEYEDECKKNIIKKAKDKGNWVEE